MKESPINVARQAARVRERIKHSGITFEWKEKHVEPQHWLQVWEKSELGFHQADGNPMLHRWLPDLGLASGARVLVPLCGKTADMAWLAAQGFTVTGVELSERAAVDFFGERAIDPVVTQVGGFSSYSASGVTILVGDFFAADALAIGSIGAIYDRAALVALPHDMRTKYAAHLADITDSAPQLLVTFEYDQQLMPGPPFRVDDDEVQRLYGDMYRMTKVDQQPLPGGLRGTPAQECAWLLRP